MDTTQLAQMVTWLDEQHRRDRAEIAKLQQRLEAQTNEMQEQARRLKELEARLTSVQAQLTRFTQLEQALQNLKNELTLLVNNQAEELTKAQREAERIRMSDREAFTRGLAEVRKDLQRLRSFEEELAVRKAEERRLSEIVLDLRQGLSNLGKDIEERTRTIPYLSEQRAHDNKRIAQLQQENVELFKRLEEAIGKLTLLEHKQQRLESQIIPLISLVEEMKRTQEQFIEALKLADVDRQRQMKEWAEVFESQKAAIERFEQRLQEFTAVFEEARRATAGLTRFQEQLQREQTQLAELQRLAEERQRKELAAFMAEHEKRMKKQALEWEYQWDQQHKFNAALKDEIAPIRVQLAHHHDMLAFFWRYVEAQGHAHLHAAQQWLDEIEKLAGERQRLLKAYEETKLRSS